jgi:hypothetical protein
MRSVFVGFFFSSVFFFVDVLNYIYHAFKFKFSNCPLYRELRRHKYGPVPYPVTFENVNPQFMKR